MFSVHCSGQTHNCAAHPWSSPPLYSLQSTTAVILLLSQTQSFMRLHLWNSTALSVVLTLISQTQISQSWFSYWSDIFSVWLQNNWCIYRSNISCSQWVFYNIHLTLNQIYMPPQQFIYLVLEFILQSPKCLKYYFYFLGVVFPWITILMRVSLFVTFIFIYDFKCM